MSIKLLKQYVPHARITSAKILSMTTVFLLGAPMVVIYYGAFVFNPANADNVFMYIIQVVADIIAIIALLGLWVTVLMDVITQQHHRSHHFDPGDFLVEKKPTIDIFVTAMGESLETLEETLTAAINMDYPHNTFILDDGKSDALKKFAQSLGVIYVVRPDRRHAKAGNVNNGLRFSKSEFFAIFDADQVPKKDFITRLLPYMKDSKMAMVQSPQYFANTHSFIAAGTSQAQEVFYKYVCPAKNISNSAFCVGTNVVFRRSAIEDIGGIARNNSEDIWTSYQLHENGWHTIFVNEVLAIGEAPATVVSYFKQQRRWAKGGLSMLFTKNPLRSKKLNLDQKMQYFISNSFFLVGVSIFVYVLFPILYLLFGIKPLDTENGIVWVLHYVPYFALYYSLTYLFLGSIRLETLSTALASFYPYLLGLFSALFDTEQVWVATTSRKNTEDAFMKWAWPHVFIIFLSLFSLVVGWYNPYNFWTTVFNTAWVVLNAYLLFLFITGEKRIVKNRNNIIQ
ncbi:MAG: glycosyltransferase [Candidatus Moranbacteria bacterium]|nr:glycosyltransferase [Candidatus Moranbacteria bacterium]